MDYSGEIYGHEHNHPEGLSSGGQIGIGNLILFVANNYDEWGIKGWANQVFSARNYNNAVNDVSDFLHSAVGFFKSLFGGGSSHKTQAQPIATPQFSNYQSTTGWQDTGFTNGGVNHAVYSGDGDPPIETDNDKSMEIIGPETPIQYPDGSFNPDAYNCHSYAWCNSLGDPTDPENTFLVSKGVTKWDNNPANNKNGYHQISFDTPNKIGDRVVYYAWNSKLGKTIATHSAIVTKVNNTGQAIRLTSKFGQSYLAIHHPRNIPISYGASSPTFTAPNGKVYPSRIYYRKN